MENNKERIRVFVVDVKSFLTEKGIIFGSYALNAIENEDNPSSIIVLEGSHCSTFDKKEIGQINRFYRSRSIGFQSMCMAGDVDRVKSEMTQMTKDLVKKYSEWAEIK